MTSAEMVADGQNSGDLKPALAENVVLPIEATAGDNVAEPGGSLDKNPSAASLTGYWRACNLVTNTGFFSSWNGKSDIFFLEQIKDDVTLYAMSNGEKKSVAGHGAIEGNQLRIALPMSDGPMINKQMTLRSDSSIPAVDETEPAAPDIAPATVPGSESLPAEEVAAANITEETKGEEAASSTQELVCTGSVLNGDSMMLSCIEEGGTKNPPFALDSEFTRLTKRDVAELKIMSQRIHEMEILATALKAYHTANDSTYPEELNALNDGYLELPQLTVSGGSRIIEYNRDSLDTSLGLTRAPSASDDATDVLHRQNLLRLEEEALANWPEFPYLPPLLRIRYSAPPMILQVREANPSSVERVDPGNVLRCLTPLVDGHDPDTIEKLKVSCQNNMKQLGLCVGLFRKDDKFNRDPAGWAMMFGSYISDDVMPTCPGRREANEPGRTSSYTLLFPAINNEELTQIVAAIRSAISSFDEIKHVVPMIVENHPCADGKSRNVVFWDGHAERIDDSDWARVVTPFVAASEAYRDGF